MKNYLIIGASSGIGLALAQQLKSEANVYGTFNKISSDEAGIQWQVLNVLDAGANLINLPEVLDGIVYCPGAINLKPFARISAEDFAADYQLQVIGAIKIIQQVLPLLKKSSHASIVLFSTVAVQTGFNFHTLVAASKGAIEGFSKALAAELAPIIRVNVIAPSITNTPLAAALLNTPEKIEANAQRHPLKKIGTSEQVAAMAAFLLSDHASWITGQIMHVDGGMSTLKV
jgi:NAD(P)-dependent dehydrogenase (short-subunit alcohol dehydrogenase family)